MKDDNYNRYLILIAIGGVLWLAIGFAVYKMMQNPDRQAAPVRALIAPDYTGLELSPLGTLPNLQRAANRNASLAERLKALAERDAAFFFIETNDADLAIARILFLWAGYEGNDLNEGRRRFIRAAYGLPDTDDLRNHPLITNGSWNTLFTRYKMRLILQIVGDEIFNGPIYYYADRDRIRQQADVNVRFISDLYDVLRNHPDPAPFIANYIGFIDATKGLRNLSPREQTALAPLERLGER